MSSGADCHLFELNPGEWYYSIQQWPYGEWPHYDRHGPFIDERACLDHLSANYQNPGSYSISPWRPKEDG